MYTCVPHPEPSSLLPPHTIPLGRTSALAPSIQYHALNLDWRLVSYMILYVFQCHSPNHPTLSLSHRVQKTVLYISVSFAGLLFFYFIFKLYNIVLVLPNIEMNPPHVYMCSPSWTLFPPPSPFHPSGSQCFLKCSLWITFIRVKLIFIVGSSV